MKRVAALTVALALVISCTGDRGPAGPQGPQGTTGPEGPPGATIVYVTGVISAGDYDQDGWINIDDQDIREDAVTQVYFSRDKDAVAWITPEFQLTNGRVYIEDVWQD